MKSCSLSFMRSTVAPGCGVEATDPRRPRLNQLAQQNAEPQFGRYGVASANAGRPPAQPANGGGDMGILGWIVLGLLAGAIAKAIMPGDDPGGIIVTMLIGIVGAIVGGLIASALDIGQVDEFFDIGTWVIAILGALLLLGIYRVIAGKRAGAGRT
jgi:uncharacterized membrane protein YeaQ/YmgE (transglycosylase-associated protein family)